MNKGSVEPLVKMLASSDETCVFEAVGALEVLSGIDEGIA